MKKSILYMIKRIIIGVGIILVLGFINSCEVNALSFTNFTDLSVYTMGLSAGDRERQGTINLTNTQGTRYQWATSFNLSSVNIPQSVDYFIFNLSRTYTFSQTNSVAVSAGSIEIINSDKYVENFIVQIQYQVGDNVLTTNCEVENENVFCPTFKNYTRINNLVIQVNWIPYVNTGGASFYYYFFLSGNYSTGMQISKNQNDIQQQQLEEQKETNDLLKDTSTPSNNDIDNVINGATTDNATISDLVNLIPNTLQVIVNGLNQGCTGGYNLGSLFGTDLILPCINPVDYLGSFLWGVIDSILCLCYLIPFSKWIVNTYNDLTSLKNRRLM